VFRRRHEARRDRDIAAAGSAVRHRSSRGATAPIVILGAESADTTGFERLAAAILLLTALGHGARRGALALRR